MYPWHQIWKLCSNVKTYFILLKFLFFISGHRRISNFFIEKPHGNCFIIVLQIGSNASFVGCLGKWILAKFICFHFFLSAIVFLLTLYVGVHSALCFCNSQVWYLWQLYFCFYHIMLLYLWGRGPGYGKNNLIIFTDSI